MLNYLKDEDRVSLYWDFATEKTYYGRNGENIKTMVCGGRNYCAWLFYDSEGGNLQLGDKIIQSIKHKYSPLEQMKIRSQNMSLVDKTSYYFTIALALFGVLFISFVLPAAKYKKEKKAQLLQTKEIVGILVLTVVVMSLIVIGSEYTKNPFGNTYLLVGGVFLVVASLLSIGFYRFGEIVFRKRINRTNMGQE